MRRPWTSRQVLLAWPAAVLLVALSSDPAAAQNSPRYVDNLRNCNKLVPCYSTIQAAVDASGPGDILGIFPGVYHEAVTIDPARTDLRLQPFSSGQPPVIRAPAGTIALTIHASNTQVMSLMLEAEDTVILDAAPSGTLIQGNIIRAILPGYSAVTVTSADAVVKANDVIGGGIFVGPTTGVMIANNQVTAAQVDGISLGNTQNTIVQANIVRTANRYGILLAGTVIGNTVQDNVVTTNGSSGIFATGDGVDFGANLFRRNTAVDNSPCDVYDTYTTPSTVTPDFWQNNRTFIQCGSAQ